MLTILTLYAIFISYVYISIFKKEIIIILYNIITLLIMYSIIIYMGKYIISSYLIMMVMQNISTLGLYNLYKINKEKVIINRINYKNSSNIIINIINFIFIRQHSIIFNILYNKKIKANIDSKLILSILGYILSGYGYIFGEQIHILYKCIKKPSKRWDEIFNIYMIKNSNIEYKKIYIYKIKEYNGFLKLPKINNFKGGIKEIKTTEENITTTVIKSKTPKGKIVYHLVLRNNNEIAEAMRDIVFTHNPLGIEAFVLKGDKETKMMPIQIESLEDISVDNVSISDLQEDMDEKGVKTLNVGQMCNEILIKKEMKQFKTDKFGNSKIETLKIKNSEMDQIKEQKSKIENTIKIYDLSPKEIHEIMKSKETEDILDIKNINK